MKLDFLILVKPSCLRGIDIIWRIYLDCNKKDLELCSQIINLITNLYYRFIESKPLSEILEIQDEFIQNCLLNLRNVAKNTTLNDEDKKLSIKS